MAVSKICNHCGKEFFVPNRRHEEVKFCSIDCKSAAGRVNLECPVCGVSFEKKKSEIRGETTYCSKECSFRARKGRSLTRKNYEGDIVKECIVCGKKFEVIRSRGDKAKYCSTECKYSSEEFRKASSEANRGENSWRYKGEYKPDYEMVHKKGLFTKFAHREIVFNAIMKENPNHPFIVEINGVKRLHIGIDVHHIDKDTKNNDISNLLAVTKAAHAKIHHWNRKPEPYECWPSNPAKW